VDHLECCVALEIEVTRFAQVLSTTPSDAPIDTCPGWNTIDLTEHLGLIHRWADELVKRRSPERIARAASVENRDDVRPAWFEAGGRALVATLLEADPNDPMWAWGRDQHVRFWSRRQLHETLVHRMDLELAGNHVPECEPMIAFDAVDEYLSNMESVAMRSSEFSALRGKGEGLRFRARDSSVMWTVVFDEEGFCVSTDDERVDAELVGSPVDLLLTMLGRQKLDQGAVDVTGDRRLVELWFSHSAFD
jgi:uncharacterized protein (TIGR03083 family)